jgi:hypothetical protein
MKYIPEFFLEKGFWDWKNMLENIRLQYRASTVGFFLPNLRPLTYASLRLVIDFWFC